jgi:hypothetical protein
LQHCRDAPGAAAQIVNSAGRIGINAIQKIKRRAGACLIEFQILMGIPTHKLPQLCACRDFGVREACCSAGAIAAPAVPSIHLLWSKYDRKTLGRIRVRRQRGCPVQYG